jgi:hypothetical protein
MTRTFISYHHANDQAYKDQLVNWASLNGLMQDMSVSTGEINDEFDSETIRRIIRDQYLRNSEVTILLAGRETRYRKHVDWELKSTMIDGRLNRRSGILVINLPNSGSDSWHTVFPREKELIYPDYEGRWRNIARQAEYEDIFPNMPRRILENLTVPGVSISIVPWDRVYGYPDRFRYLLAETAKVGPLNQYDLSRRMRRKNFNPGIDWLDTRL